MPVVSPPGPQRVPPGLLQTAGIIFIMYIIYIYIYSVLIDMENKKNRKRSRIVQPFKAERKIIFKF